MVLVTIDGHIGAGGGELGRRVAKMLDLEYVDRLVLPGSSRLANPAAPQPALHARLWTLLERAARGFALGNAAGDPYFAAAELMMLPLTWDSSPGAPMAAPGDGHGHERSLQAIIERGRSVLVQRAGAVALRGHRQVLKIGVFAAWEDRVRRIMHSQGFTRVSDAERIIRERETAQSAYFRTIHSAHPEDEGLYDICLDTSREQVGLAALKVARAARSVVPALS